MGLRDAGSSAAGLPVQGTFGPEPVTPGKLAELNPLRPGVVLAS